MDGKDLKVIKSLTIFDSRILVSPIPKERITSAGIIIPDTINMEIDTAEIILVGEEENDIYEDIIKPGQIILFSKYSGNDIIIFNKKYLLMDKGHIYAIVENLIKI